jgi:hypothetical protein
VLLKKDLKYGSFAPAEDDGKRKYENASGQEAFS